MKWNLYLLLVISLWACNSKTSSKNIQEVPVTNIKAQTIIQTISTQDSTQIQNLIRQVYAWNEQNLKPYFNIGLIDTSGQHYIGIDWEQFNQNKKALLATGFFSQSFIANYKATLEHIEQKLNAGAYNNGWQVGNMPPFGTGANEWCHCQDTPSLDFYKYLEIHDLKLRSNNRVSLHWNWGTDVNWNTNFKYPVEVIKENGVWKIAYLDGFDQKYY